MSFTYQLGANPAIDFPRLLVSDTQSTGHVFEDEEILIATQVETGTWQSAQKYSGSTGLMTLPSVPVPYRRIAATLLDALAANKARLASIKQMLDVKLDSSDAAIQLRETAQALRDADDNSGAFVLIEQVNDTFSFRDRFWKQVQRQTGG